MPSITSWNRIEPRPRTDSIARALMAQVRDPLWFLTRQWQFGEFRGDDAASPAWVQFRASFSRIDGWRRPGADPHAYDGGASPLEAPAETEPSPLNVAAAVEAGQEFEARLTRAFAAASAGPPEALRDLLHAFRTAYALPQLPPEDPDDRTRRFLRVCSGRAIDGARLRLETANTDVPAQPPVADPTLRVVVGNAVRAWREWVDRRFGPVRSTADPETWDGARLAYRVEVSAATPDGGRATLDAHPGREGAFDWYAFDELSSEPGGGEPTRTLARSLLPIPVRFRGMPHARWWQMQDRVADLGEIHPELREIAKLVLMDFLFVHGNDWFLVPFSQDVGSLCRIDRLVVHDVFGGRTLVERADREGAGAAATRRWSMFAVTSPASESGFADYFILPPSAGATTLTGDTLESVRFLRDEMANMVWAVERTTENGIGQPWPGRERTQGRRRQEMPPPAAPIAPLRYQIQSSVPEHWIPFVPVQIDANGQVALQRSAMLAAPDPETGQRATILPVGRILSGPDPYRVREEEVPRSGVDVTRVARRTRWIDGSTHLWVARRKRPGGGEGASGLRFDVVERSEG